MQFQTIKVRLRFVVEPDDGGFYAYCPELKGLHVCGDTEEEAITNAKDAATAYLQSLLKHDDPLPVGSQRITYSFADLCRGAWQKVVGRKHLRIEELALHA